MTTPSPGPASQGKATTMLALNDEYGRFSITSTLAAGPLDDLGPPTLWGYSSGSTTRLILTAASGGTTINGLDASDVTDGFTILIVNNSATDGITFAHQAPTSQSANQFTLEYGGSVYLPAYGSARATYVTNKWRFA